MPKRRTDFKKLAAQLARDGAVLREQVARLEGDAAGLRDALGQIVTAAFSRGLAFHVSTPKPGVFDPVPENGCVAVFPHLLIAMGPNGSPYLFGTLTRPPDYDERCAIEISGTMPNQLYLPPGRYVLQK